MVGGGSDSVLAIDIGATTIKSCVVSRVGEQLEVPRRRATPYPCTPPRLVEVVSARIDESDNERVGVGFPGEFASNTICVPSCDHSGCQTSKSPLVIFTGGPPAAGIT